MRNVLQLNIEENLVKKGIIILMAIFLSPATLDASNDRYAVQAKRYIERAKSKMADDEKRDTSKEIELMEKRMLNETLAQQVPPYIEPPLRVEEAGTGGPIVEPPPLRKKMKEKKITLDFDKVDLKSVSLFISQEAGVNIVLSQKVLDLGLKVSVTFRDGTVDEVIRYITKSQGLVFRYDKDIVWIAHPEEVANELSETRVYYLARGGGLFTEFSPTAGSTSSAVSGASSEVSLGGSSSQIGKISTIADILKEVISWPGDAKLVYDKRINALIVRNTPQNLQALEDMLYSLDVTPHQVLIEARFLEVDITDVGELGMEWKLDQAFPLDKTQSAGRTLQQILKNSGVDFSAFTYASYGANFTYQGLLTNPQLQVVLHALRQTTKLKTLSSPRITTLNNQMATMKVVDEWIYPTRYEYEIVQVDLNGDGDYKDAGETVYKNVPKDFIRRDVGIILKVIPSVGADKKTISLSLIPEVTEGSAGAFSYGGNVTLPKFTSRNLSTTVVVNSGDTVILGGMIKESRTKTVTKVPIVGDIPLIGELFKKDADSIQRKNLLIFVTAKVLSSSGEELVVAQK